MRKFRFSIIFLLSFCQAFAASEVIEKNITKRLEKEIVPIIEKDMARLKVPGLSMAIVSDGKVLWKKGFGYQNREEKLPATPETVYRVGSISKLFNAIAIMQQQEKGKLDIDSEIKRYLPYMDFENPFDRPAIVTLRHFLSHKAGILRECPVGHYFDDTEPSIEETAKSMAGTILVYPPGLKTKYSNIGVGIAGHVLEKVVKKDFAEYQKEFLLIPLGMNTSSFLPENFIKKKVAEGYMRDLEGKQWKAPHFRFGYLPAANLYSTVIDLSKFITFILNEGKPLLKNETFKEMNTVQFTDKKDASGFGLGFSVSKLHNFRSVGHGGAVYGFSSNLIVIPEQKLGAVVLNNLDGANGFNYKIAYMSLGIALEEKTGKKILKVPESVEITSSELKRYEGRYERNGLPVWLVLRKEKLFYEPYGTGKQLIPVSQEEFITDDLLGYGERIGIMEEDGRLKGIHINKKLYKKTEENERVKVLPPILWDRLIGDYGPDYNIMKVYEKDGKLTVLIEWFYEYPLLQVEGLRFKFPDYGLYMDEEFVFKEKKGKIVEVMVGPVSFKRRR